MLNLFKKSKKKVECAAKRSPNCEGKMYKYNRMKDGQPICEPCTNL